VTHRHPQGRRAGLLFLVGAVPLALLLLGASLAGPSSAAPKGTAPAVTGATNSPQPLSNADRTGKGANPGTTAGCGAY
jgi:hypothetical protein